MPMDNGEWRMAVLREVMDGEAGRHGWRGGLVQYSLASIAWHLMILHLTDVSEMLVGVPSSNGVVCEGDVDEGHMKSSISSSINGRGWS